MPEIAAKLIVEHKIPYTVAVGLVEKVTPSILAALVNAMSPQELINNIASLEEKGAMDVPAIKVIIDKKLEKAKTAKGVAAMKSKTAVATGRIKDEGTAKKLEAVADRQIKSHGSITLSTAVLVDRSRSMSVAIETGKRIAAMISGATTADLRVVVFDDKPMEVTAEGKEMSDWDRAFMGVKTGGWTSIGVGLDLIRHKKYVVEQVVVVTDEGENANPMFVDVYRRYEREMGVSPHVVIVRVGRPSSAFSNNLTRAGIEYDRYEPENGDYYGLPGLVQLLSRKSRLDLVYEIMDEPLRTRRPFK